MPSAGYRCTVEVFWCQCVETTHFTTSARVGETGELHLDLDHERLADATAREIVTAHPVWTPVAAQPGRWECRGRLEPRLSFVCSAMAEGDAV